MSSGLRPLRPTQETQKPSSQAAEAKLKLRGSRLTDADRESLFQEFLAWERVRRQHAVIATPDRQHTGPGTDAQHGSRGTSGGASVTSSANVIGETAGGSGGRPVGGSTPVQDRTVVP
jgi:hypothetical protein